MYTKTDIFFITLFIVVVSIIIGLNIVMVIDKKISNVSVNIPPLKVPEANIILNVSKDDNEKIIIKACGENIKTKLEQNKNTTQQSIMSDIDIDKPNLEKFTVSDAQEVNQYKELKDELFKESDNFNDTSVCTNDIPVPDIPKYANKKPEKSIMVSDDPPIETYRKGRLEKAYITALDFGWDPPKHYVSCANSSIANQYKTGNKSLLPNQVSCGNPNKLTAENYYKTHYRMQVVPIEDYHVRGANYMDYVSFPTPYQTRYMRILSQNTKGLPPDQTKYKNIPIGANYAFHNTPAMPMP